jgi:predicted house-cleaning NTP pyrophosphatase (Maf/HAM1 superfamily)
LDATNLTDIFTRLSRNEIFNIYTAMSFYISSENFEELKERQVLFGKISAADLRDYSKLLGWSFIHEALSDKLFVANNPNFARRQINFL